MSSSLPSHARVPPGRRRVGGNDLLVIQRACAAIRELGTDLDRRLETESGVNERLRLLRAATNRITRSANDAILAYGRARRAIDAEVSRGHHVQSAMAMREQLRAARLDLLGALATASQRYPPTEASRDIGRATGERHEAP